jgi:hypothetical protein
MKNSKRFLNGSKIFKNNLGQLGIGKYQYVVSFFVRNRETIERETHTLKKHVHAYVGVWVCVQERENMFVCVVRGREEKKEKVV